MCLYSKEYRASCAKEPIKCYKVLRCYDGDDGVYYFSPFYGDRAIDSLTIKGQLPYRALGTVTVKENEIGLNCGKFKVTKGFIHTYKDFYAAELIAWPERSYSIFECEIPVGTEYYEGVDDSQKSTYASECIIFKKLVKGYVPVD
jgi:hypothetical protein